MNWTYLGDGLYAAVRPDETVVLRANGTDESCPTVFLEPEVWANLIKWAVEKRVGQ